jgi:predicted ester cyclase
LSEKNKDIARRYYVQAHSTWDVDLVDQLLTANFIHHNPFPGMAPDRQGTKQTFSLFPIAFPDAEFEVKDMIAEGDRVAVRRTFGGTHEGEFLVSPLPAGDARLQGGTSFGSKETR